jgi:Flp pilus assembly pilin Flp
MNLKVFCTEEAKASAAQYALWAALLAIAVVAGIAILGSGSV